MGEGNTWGCGIQGKRKKEKKGRMVGECRFECVCVDMLFNQSFLSGVDRNPPKVYVYVQRPYQLSENS